MIEAYIPSLIERRGLKMVPGEFKVSGDGVFFTIQGEGENIGKPAVFLRLNFCNLKCNWCDTRYTWDKNSKEFWQESENWSYEKTLEELVEYPIKRLVITGGEPLLQQARIANFASFIPDWEIEIETNGTIAPAPELITRCQFNVSPKLDNSGNSLSKRYKPDVLRQFNELARTTFKFVAQEERDLDEISQLIEECDLEPARIIIMPEGTTQEEIKAHGLQIVNAVKARGWRLVPRLHVMLWGDERRK